jgi:hypothetical protein
MKILKYRFGIVLTLLIISLVYIGISSVAIVTYSNDCEKTRSELEISKEKSLSDRASRWKYIDFYTTLDEAMQNINEGRVWLSKFMESMMIEDYENAAYYVGQATPYFEKADSLYLEYQEEKAKLDSKT